MRLEQLQMEGFSSFLKRETVEFHRLDGETLVLINGKTGAGKTSILDGICYALYGESSGEARKASDLRANEATLDDPTEVTLDFAIRDRRYRIRRSPEYTRAKKRGGGTTTQKSSVTLFERTEVGPGDTRDGKVLETQHGGVAKRIGELLHLNVQQFRQVVMLPQGKFREFLEAKSDTREAILQSLFQTKQFDVVAEKLAARARELQGRLDASMNARNTLLEQAEVASLEALEQQVKTRAAAKAEAEAAIPALDQARSTAEAALQRGRDIEVKLKALRDAMEAHRALDAQTTAMSALKARIERASQAIALKERVQHLAQADKDVANAKTSVERALESEARATQTLETAREAHAALEARRPELEALNTELNSIESHAAGRNELDKMRATEQECLDDATARAREAKDARVRHETCAQRLEALDAERGQLAGSATALRAATDHLDRCRAQAGKHGELLEQRVQIARQETLVAGSDAQISTLQQERDAVHAALATMEQAWREGRAGALARTLEAGVACPVCGSEQHPDPARARDDTPSEEQLEACKKERKAAEDSLEAERGVLDTLKSKLAGWRGAVDQLVDGLGEWAELDADTVADRVTEAERTKLAAEKAHQRYEEVEEELKEEAPRKQEATAALEAAVEAAKLADNALVEARSRREVQEQQIPEQYREPGALEARRTELQDAREDLRRRLELASVALTECTGTARETAAKARGQESNLQKAVARRDALAAKLTSGRAEVGLDADEVWHQALEDLAQLDALKHERETWSGNMEAAIQRRTRAEQETEGLTPADITALNAAYTSAKDAYDAGSAAAILAGEQLVQAQKLRTSVQSELSQFQELEAQHRVVESVASVARGKREAGASTAKISFQRYVLASYLDEVLHAASARLTRMSEGQYTLQRKRQTGDGVTGDRRSTAGLEIEVLDGHTGRPRDVSTLSGGEGFLTSLALSLGLADVATAEAGGIRLDTLFIDEGFGTLDPEALEKSLEILAKLQEGGRLVGIISHVPELKRRIRARIDVTKTSAGSRVTLHTA